MYEMKSDFPPLFYVTFLCFAYYINGKVLNLQSYCKGKTLVEYMSRRNDGIHI